MWAFVCGLAGSLWVAWGSAGMILSAFLLSVFRSRFSLESITLWLMMKAVGIQEGVIRDQQKLIDIKDRLIATRERQMMLEGIIPWEDVDE